MFQRIHRVAFVLVLNALGSLAMAQAPEAGPEHAVLKMDVGTWKATVKMWMGADGSTDPKAEPSVSEGEEVNRLMGPYWVVSDFKGEFAGFPFEGHAISGYDLNTKKYVGSWIDSVSPFAMHMSGTYDKETRTITSSTKGVGMDGEPTEGKSVMVYQKDGRRIMTMYEIKDGKEVRAMEITYERLK